jgi:hypothetical protein
MLIMEIKISNKKEIITNRCRRRDKWTGPCSCRAANDVLFTAICNWYKLPLGRSLATMQEKHLNVLIFA